MSRQLSFSLLLMVFCFGCMPKEHFGPIYSAEDVSLDGDRVKIRVAEKYYQAVQELIPAPMQPIIDQQNTYIIELPIQEKSTAPLKARLIDQTGSKIYPSYLPVPSTDRWLRLLASEKNKGQLNVFAYRPGAKPEFACTLNAHLGLGVFAFTRAGTHLLEVNSTSATLYDLGNGQRLEADDERVLSELYKTIGSALGRDGLWSLSDNLRFVLVSPPTERETKGMLVSVNEPVKVSVAGMELDLHRDAVIYDRTERRIIRIEGGDRFHRPCWIATNGDSPVILYGQPGYASHILPAFVKALHNDNEQAVNLHEALMGHQIKSSLCSWDSSQYRVAMLSGGDPSTSNDARDRTPERLNGRYRIEVFDYQSQTTVLRFEFDSSMIGNAIANAGQVPAP